MTNGLNNNSKVWYTSRTLWLLLAQLISEWSFVVAGEVSWKAGVVLTMTTVATTVRRFYTTTGLKSKKEVSEKFQHSNR